MRLVRVVVGPVDHVNTQDADGLLLELVVVVEHPHVQRQVIKLAVGPGLETQAQPAVALDGARVVDGGHGIGKDEEGGVGPLVAQTVHH